ncbi:TPA: hypothetical protein EYP66_07585 [Candidatus Poribacteria bacterium]|nr:hypothetical protein [Candidatus Poribacteria bacterium]
MQEQRRRTQGQDVNENGNEGESQEERNEFLPKIEQEERERYERVFAKLYQLARKMPEEMTFYVVAALVKAGREEIIIAATNHYVFGTAISDVIRGAMRSEAFRYKHAEQALFEAVAKAKRSLQNKLKNIAKAAIGASIRRQRARKVASKIQQGQYNPIIVC